MEKTDKSQSNLGLRENQPFAEGESRGILLPPSLRLSNGGAVPPPPAPNGRVYGGMSLIYRKLQKKEANTSENETVNSETEAGIQSMLGQGSPLPGKLQRYMSSAMRSDFSQVRVHDNAQATALSEDVNANAFTLGSDIFFNKNQYQPESHQGQKLIAHELTHVVQQGGTQVNRKIQRDDKDPPSKSWLVYVGKEVDGTGFQVIAAMQIYGVSEPEAQAGVLSGKYKFTGPHSSGGVHGDEVGTSITVVRSGSNEHTEGGPEGEGMSTSERSSLMSGMGAEDQKAMMDEINRRFWERSGLAPGTQLSATDPNQQGARDRWKQIRDEVLAEHKIIQEMPPHIRAFLTRKQEEGGATINFRDYNTIARLIETLKGMTPEELDIYLRRTNSTTTDWGDFEKSVNAFLTDLADEKRVIERLRGKEYIWDAMVNISTVAESSTTVDYKSEDLIIDHEAIQDAEDNYNAKLIQGGFADSEDFHNTTAAYLKIYERHVREIALLALEHSEKMLTMERDRYKDPLQYTDLYNRLGNVRGYASDYAEASSRANTFSTGGDDMIPLHNPTANEYLDADDDKQSARASGEAEVAELSSLFPLLKDENLDFTELNTASASELGTVLVNDANARLSDIRDARTTVLTDTEALYGMDNILPYANMELGVQDGDIYDRIIKAEQKRIGRKKIIKGIFLALLAIGLGLMTMGTGTVAVIGAVGSVALSSYMVYDAAMEYETQRELANSHYDKAYTLSSENPSAFWLALAIVGLAIDAAALIKVFRTLAPAAEAFTKTKNLTELENAVEAAAKTDSAIAKYKLRIVQAAQAEMQYVEATSQLSKALANAGKLSVLSPDAIAAMLRVGWFAAKKGIRNFQKWLAHAKATKLVTGLDGLPDDQIKALEDAFMRAEHMEHVSQNFPTYKQIFADPGVSADSGLFTRYKNMEKEFEDLQKTILEDPAAAVPKLEKMAPQLQVIQEIADIRALLKIVAPGLDFTRNIAFGSYRLMYNGKVIEGEFLSISGAFDYAGALKNAMKNKKAAEIPPFLNQRQVMPSAPKSRTFPHTAMNQDSEQKFAEFLAKRAEAELGVSMTSAEAKNISGTISITSEMTPCPTCQDVLKVMTSYLDNSKVSFPPVRWGLPYK